MNLLLEHNGFLFALGEARRIAFALEVDVIEFLQRQLGRGRFFKLKKAFPDGSVRHAHDLTDSLCITLCPFVPLLHMHTKR